jgi:hypothetical protein
VSTENQQPEGKEEVAQPNAEQAANGILKIEAVTPPAADEKAAEQAPEQSTGASGTVTQTGASQTPPTVKSITTPVVAAPAVLTPEPTPVKPAAPLLPEIAAIFEKAKGEATAAGKMILDQLEAYIAEMAPKKLQTQANEVRWQVQLYRVLSNTANRLDDDFFLVWNTILKVFHAQKDGVFHEAYVFRSMQHITLPPNDQAAFQRLLNLVKITANPAGRQAATKQVDFKRTLEHGVTEAGRQKLLNFYNI